MRISLCNEVIAGMPFERQCAFARDVGYDGIEIAPVTLTDDPTAPDRSQTAEWRRAAAEAGLPITSLHYLLRAPAGLSITTADAAVRRRTVDVMRALCALAGDLGARALVHGSPDQRALAPGEEDEGRKRGIDCFAAVAEAAAQAGVVYCIEPLARNQTAFVNTVEEAAAIVRAIGSPAVRTMIDCSSAGQTESGAGRRAGAALGADRPDRSRPFQRSEPPRTGRRRDGLRSDPRGAAPAITPAMPRSSRSSTSPTDRPAPRGRSAICAA